VDRPVAEISTTGLCPAGSGRLAHHIRRVALQVIPFQNYEAGFHQFLISARNSSGFFDTLRRTIIQSLFFYENFIHSRRASRDLAPGFSLAFSGTIRSCEIIIGYGDGLFSRFLSWEGPRLKV